MQIVGFLMRRLKCLPTYPPHLCSKTGGFGGTHFLIFDPKRRLWILVRTVSARRFLLVLGTKIKKKYQYFFPPENFLFFEETKAPVYACFSKYNCTCIYRVFCKKMNFSNVKRTTFSDGNLRQ